jgi:hypothetical protein
MKNRIPPKLVKFPSAKQRRMDELLEKNSEGTITANERARLKELVVEAERLMVSNAKRLADFAAKRGTSHSPEAVPLTVWVQPASAGR